MPGYESLPGSHGRFTLKVLGGFALSWEGRAVRVPRASQRLLAFLALQSGMVKRVAVAGTLWPEASERHASSNLRSALARLQGTARRALAASKLELGLADGVVVDVRHAQGLARRLVDPTVTPEGAELGMALVPVLSADLLPGWYDDWVVVEAEDWRRLRLHALEALAARLTALGRWGEAAHAAGAAVRAEPLRESARAALIQAQLAEGNQSEAVREFARYRALLDAELGLAPTPRLHDLLERLQSPQRCDHCRAVTVGS
jgi:SARP family transcriptional regulator, regulator of embCAB operon